MKHKIFIFIIIFTFSWVFSGIVMEVFYIKKSGGYDHRLCVKEFKKTVKQLYLNTF